MIISTDNLEWAMFQTKVTKKIKTHILFSITLFLKSCHLWDNVEKHTKCIIEFLLQLCFRECITMVRYTNIACLDKFGPSVREWCAAPPPGCIHWLLCWMARKANLDVLEERCISCLCRVWSKSFSEFARKLVSYWIPVTVNKNDQILETCPLFISSGWIMHQYGKKMFC
jgi:hypothetical protein